MKRLNRAFFDGELQDIPRRRLAIQGNVPIIEVDPLISEADLNYLDGKLSLLLGNSPMGIETRQNIKYAMTGSLAFPLQGEGFPLEMPKRMISGEFWINHNYMKWSNKRAFFKTSFAFPTLELIEQLDRVGISNAQLQELPQLHNYTPAGLQKFALVFETDLDRTMFVMGN